MALDHDRDCGCAICRHVRRHALPIEQADCDRLADAWALWRGGDDGEVRKLRDGEPGSPGSPRWIALQAIAATRVAIGKRAADAAPVEGQG